MLQKKKLHLGDDGAKKQGGAGRPTTGRIVPVCRLCGCAADAYVGKGYNRRTDVRVMRPWNKSLDWEAWRQRRYESYYEDCTVRIEYIQQFNSSSSSTSSSSTQQAPVATNY